MAASVLESVVPTLYRMFAARLAEFLHGSRRVPDLATAEDVVQECFTDLTERPQLVAGIRDCESWLATMAIHKALDLKRSPLASLTLPLDLGDNVEAPEIEQETPDEELARLARSLKAGMRKLTPKQAAVIGLCVVQELSFADVGFLLGLSKPTVFQHYQAALRKLTREVRPLRSQTEGRG